MTAYACGYIFIPVVINLVQAKRVERGLSQRELAEKVGCSQPYISTLERGLKGRPSYQIVGALAKALRCSPAKLFPLQEAA